MHVPTHNPANSTFPWIQRMFHVNNRTTAICLITLAALSGCASPMYTRYPVMWTGHPGYEGRAFQQQDPFPDPDIGPDSGARPRDFARPRTESRKAAEQRLFQGLPASPAFAPQGYPRGGLNRPAAVY